MVKDGGTNTRSAGIAQRLAVVEARVAAAAQRSGRSRSDILVVGVTKGVEPDSIRQALAAGLCDLGENRIQEWLPKATALGHSVRWHFIGRLQTNKVRYLRQGVSVLHSLDRPALLGAITERWSAWAQSLAAESSTCGTQELTVPACYVQVNVTGEPAKAGVSPSELAPLLAKIQAAGVIRLGGLMTIAPYTDDPESVRWVFTRLRELRDTVWQRFPELDLSQLSMGMSGDFEQAIEEGATIVRLGSVIFGPRG